VPDALPFGSYGRIGETSCLHLQGLNSPLIMEAAGFSVTLAAIHQAIWHHFVPNFI
jgi:hypothetical protein